MSLTDATPLRADKRMKHSGHEAKRKGGGGLLLGNGVYWLLFVLTLTLRGSL